MSSDIFSLLWPTYLFRKFGQIWKKVFTFIMALRHIHMSNFWPMSVCQSPFLALWRVWVPGTKFECLSLVITLNWGSNGDKEEFIPKHINIAYHLEILGWILESYVKCDGVSTYRINIYWPIYSISHNKFCTFIFILLSNTCSKLKT